MKRFLLPLLVIFSVFNNAVAADLETVLQQSYRSCVGISDMLTDMKKLAGINTAVTGVGTVAGGGALIAGIKKARLMEQLRNLEEGIFERTGTFPTQHSEDIVITRDPNFKPNLKYKKAKRLGNWRTGLLAVNTATNIAGAAIASKNLNSSDDLRVRVQDCIKSMDELQRAMSQAKVQNVNITEAKEIYDECSEWKRLDLSVLEKRARGAQVTSAVGAGAGAVGVITSALANNAKTYEKEKKLDTASNVLAGGATVLSGGATVFNAIQISAIKKIADVAQRCENVLR